MAKAVPQVRQPHCYGATPRAGQGDRQGSASSSLGTCVKNSPGISCHALAAPLGQPCEELHHQWDTLTLCILSSITGVSVPPWSECQRRGSTSTALAEPGLGWQHGAAHHHPCRQQDEGWAGAGGCPQFGLHGRRSALAPEQGRRSAPEALPKDRAVNCYLSNEAVSDCLG